MATCFQQKTEDAQPSGFHSRVWKGFVSRVLTFQPISPVFVPFCSILPCAPYLLPSAVSRLVLTLTLVSLLSLHCIVPICCLRQSMSPRGEMSLWEPSTPFACVQVVSLPSSPFTTMTFLSYRFPYLYSFPISPPFPCSSISTSLAFSFTLAADSSFSPQVTCASKYLVLVLCSLFIYEILAQASRAGWPSYQPSWQIVVTYCFLSPCPAFGFHSIDFCPLNTKQTKLPLCG